MLAGRPRCRPEGSEERVVEVGLEMPRLITSSLVSTSEENSRGPGCTTFSPEAANASPSYIGTGGSVTGDEKGVGGGGGGGWWDVR